MYNIHHSHSNLASPFISKMFSTMRTHPTIATQMNNLIHITFRTMEHKITAQLVLAKKHLLNLRHLNCPQAILMFKQKNIPMMQIRENPINSYTFPNINIHAVISQLTAGCILRKKRMQPLETATY